MVAKPSADAKASGFNEKARLALRDSAVPVFFYAPVPRSEHADHPKDKDERTAKPLRVSAGRIASTPTIQKKGGT